MKDKKTDAGPDQIYVADRWTKYQYQRAVEGDDKAAMLIERGAAKVYSFPRFTREVFGRLFADEMDEVEKVRPEDQWAADAHRELGELSNFERLRRRCRGDRVVASAATMAFAETVLERLPSLPKPLEDPQPLRDQVKGLMEFAKNTTGPEKQAIEAAMAEAQRRGREAVQAAATYAEALEGPQVRSALRGACAAATTAVNAVEEQLGAFSGWGASGKAGESVSIEVKAELARQVSTSDKLQRLAREAGRMRRIASAKQRSKCEYAREEVVDIGLGDDLARLLPSELVKFADPVLRLEVGRRLLEKSVLQYELGGKEAQGRGPIVVCIDESSSKEGSREIWSKALALALLQIATMQRRMCRVIAFNAQVVRTTDWASGKVDPRELLRSMEPFAGGGTSFEPVLTTALAAIDKDAALKKADVVLITDGQAEVDEEFVKKWKDARRRHGFTCYAVHVDAPGGIAPRVFADLADVVIGLADIAHDGAATDAVLGI